MGTNYDVLYQHEEPGRYDSPGSPPLSSQLNIDDENNTSSSHGGISSGPVFGQIFNSITSRAGHRYGMVEDDEYDDLVPAESWQQRKTTFPPTPPTVSRPLPARPRPQPKDAAKLSSPPSAQSEPIYRTASGRIVALRHPTPDLQVLQGAYTGNISLLEKTAERLSMTSSIDDAIRELHMEQKRNDSRRASLRSATDIPPVTRQVSNASSIIDMNNIARAGGYSPAAFTISPKDSTGAIGSRVRSASKSSRYTDRSEPELEGRPLDSFINTSGMSQTESIAEQDEGPATLTRPVVDLLGKMEDETSDDKEIDRPTSPAASTTTFDQAQKAFADFDGVHSELPLRSPPDLDRGFGDRDSFVGSDFDDLENPRTRRRRSSENRLSSMGDDLNVRKRNLSNDRLSMARPQTYADPDSGQQMVYYPAPVPMMLNLPQKLSKLPSSMARNKRRSQVLSTLPPAARQSAVWLPDVLETNDDPVLDEDDGAQNLEYLAQHQRATMGGRRLTSDLDHLPPQLRANAFFDLPSPHEVVEVKEQSAVATLDSILDASAHAPVSAFTDHAFAGHLGAEVYGKSKGRSKKSTASLAAEQNSKKRSSTINLLRSKKSSSVLLDGNESSDEKGEGQSRLDGEDNEDLSEEDDDEEVEYSGAPTTLLAELQLRKQQQKQRTRPVNTPNGLHSTLLELDAVAQVDKQNRYKRRVNLAWEDPAVQVPEEAILDEEEDVPLAILYSKKAQIQEMHRPMGLMERRDMEDNEPLSRRRDRLLGRPAQPRAATMMDMHKAQSTEGNETLAQRAHRLKEEEEAANNLPKARPVSGDFASEMMSQFGGDLLDPKGKGKEVSTSPAPEDDEEETLAQRRTRLQAEKQAQVLKKRHSLATILQAHPAAGASQTATQSKPATGLLGLREQATAQRAATMHNNIDLRPKAFLNGPPNINAGMNNQRQQVQRNASAGFNNSNMYKTNQMFPQPSMGFGFGQQPMFPQPSIGYGFGSQPMLPQYANPYMMQYPNGPQMGYSMPNLAMQNPNMAMMGADFQPLNPGQADMVERWRQSIMH